MTEMPPLAILSGGLATRMLPLTENVPKSMLKVAGEPFIAHQLRLVRREEIRRVVLCIGCKGEIIKNFVGDGSAFDLEVFYCDDGPHLLGTGGALRKALPLLGSEMLVLYGDSWADSSYGAVVGAFRMSGKPALLTIFRNKGQWDRSNVWFENGHIILHDKCRMLPQMQYIDWGLSMIKAEVLARQPADTPFDLATLYCELSQTGELAGFEVATRFYEIGSIQGLRETDLFFKSRIQLA
jgi:NDP-sugar pyrophosphorylase family protein